MSTDEAVKVAVRVRPFNKREIARNAQILLSPLPYTLHTYYHLRNAWILFLVVIILKLKTVML